MKARDLNRAIVATIVLHAPMAGMASTLVGACASEQGVGSTNASDTSAGNTSSGTTSAATTSASSESGVSPSTCLMHLDATSCRAEPGCDVLHGIETAIVDGECATASDDVVFCELAPVGGSESPSAWFEVATGRTFEFSINPGLAPDGWELCGCDPQTDAPACACTVACDTGLDTTTTSAGASTSSGGSGAGTGTGA